MRQHLQHATKNHEDVRFNTTLKTYIYIIISKKEINPTILTLVPLKPSKVLLIIN